MSPTKTHAPSCRGVIAARHQAATGTSAGGNMVKEGSKAPDFALLDDHGRPFKLSDLAGKKTVVLFFYPKADTPG
jgi:cytochrome oxidase Cu insertion factor (SCO1/SenC/PrrC family)